MIFATYLWHVCHIITLPALTKNVFLISVCLLKLNHTQWILNLACLNTHYNTCCICINVWDWWFLNMKLYSIWRKHLSSWAGLIFVTWHTTYRYGTENITTTHHGIVSITSMVSNCTDPIERTIWVLSLITIKSQLNNI